MRVDARTVTEWLYTDSKGNQKPVRDLDDGHLLNAYAKAARDGATETMLSKCRELEEVEDVLREEIMRRLGLIHSTE